VAVAVTVAVTVVVALPLLVVGSGSASAAKSACYNGARWNKKTITWSYLGKHRYRGNVWQAAANWNAVHAGIVLVEARPGQRGDIDFGDYYSGWDGLLGKTLGLPANGTLAGSDVPKSLPFSPGPITIDLNQFVLDNKLLGDKKQQNFMRTYTATHELGHALGLAHPDACRQSPVSLMRSGNYDNIIKHPPKNNEPLDYDRLELLALYPR
jgi:hypothetical protein